MTLSPTAAERILRDRFGEPAKEPTKKVIGFKVSAWRVLALRREAQTTRIWFQPPKPPHIDGVKSLPRAAKYSNLNGPLDVLSEDTTLQVEIADEAGLHRFLDWYTRR